MTETYTNLIHVFQANLQVFRKFGTIYRPFMINADLDLCATFKDEDLPLSKVLNIKERRKFGNFYDPCPITVLWFHIHIRYLSDFSLN